MDPFLGEIKLVSFSFPPQGWASCDGQTMQIVQNQALYSLLGATYGGDGKTTFALPDLRGRTPIHRNTATHPVAQKSGSEQVLGPAQLPAHTHNLLAASDVADKPVPAGNVLAAEASNFYGDAANLGTMNAGSIAAAAGGGQPHENMQPFLVLYFIIALQGIYPSRG
jgi:microcystin-dependent protein